MGSTESGKPEELTVLVTGFAPFKADFPRNPAWEITKELPDYLPPTPPKTALQIRPGAPDGSTPVLPAVRIRKYPEPIRVNYQVVRALVPTLWGDNDDKKNEKGGDEGKADGSSSGSINKIDLMLHIGMAGPRPYHSIERRGHRDGYRGRDVDDEMLDDEERHRREREKWIWHGLPHDIETDLDLDDVVERWRGYTPWDVDLRVSEDAGRYLCDFIYYSSLAHLYRKGERRRVLFLHVPADCSEDALRRGINLTIQLIRSVLESEMLREKQREKEKENEGKSEGGDGGGDKAGEH